MFSEALESLRTGPSLAFALPISLLLYLIISYVTAWYRLRHFSGPRLASFSYLWMLGVIRSNRQAASYEHINEKYGHVARIGPNDLITDDPDLIRRMSGARSTYRRSSWYFPMRLDPYDPGLFALTDTPAHDRLRAKLSFGYGGKESPSLEQDIDEQLAGLVNLIQRKYLSDRDRTKPLDMARAAQYFTMDAITKVAYGKEFGYCATDSDVHEAIQRAEQSIPFLVLMAEMPLIARLFINETALKLLGPKKTDKKGMGKILGLAKDVVAQRFTANAPDQRDMLGAFIRHGVTQRQCEIEVPFQIVAGSDTTATAIRGTMLHLAATRHAYVALQKEIDTAVAEGRISSPVTADEGRKLEYLQAVIYEGLRMQIPFSGLIMKEAPPGGDTLDDGRFIPAGTRIAHNTLAMQRRRDIFGEDVDVFRPERWLGVDKEKKQLMVQTTELVFGYGRWSCLGKPVAFIELNKVYVELLRRFDFEIMHPKQPWKEWNSNMFFQSELWMRVTERFPEGKAV